MELLIDLGEREEADLRGGLAVALDLVGGVAPGGHLHAGGIDRPVEDLADDLAVAVGGLGREAAGPDAFGDHVGDGGGGDLLEAGSADGVELASAIVRAAEIPAAAGSIGGEFEGGAALAERFAEEGEVPAPGSFWAVGLHVLDVGRDDLADGRAGGEWAVVASVAGGLELAEFLFRDLLRVGADCFAADLAALAPLDGEELSSLDQACHARPPGCVSRLGESWCVRGPVYRFVYRGRFRGMKKGLAEYASP
ncbi:MAG: hypothetical protein ACTS3F_06910 [Phycisphaerales bacterium]